MRYSSLLAASCALLPVAFAKFTQPNADRDDFAAKWLVGDTMEIAWEKGWFGGSGSQPSSVDLFVAAFEDSSSDAFSKLIQANISLDNPGSHKWKIDLDDSTVAASTEYHFRFLPHSDPSAFALNGSSLPSRGFNINAASSTSSSTAAASSTASPSSTTTSTSSGFKASKNTKAIAGGVVGGLAGIALLCIVALLLLRRVKQKRKADAAETTKMIGGTGIGSGSQLAYMPVHTVAPSDAVGTGGRHEYANIDLSDSGQKERQ